MNLLVLYPLQEQFNISTPNHKLRIHPYASSEFIVDLPVYFERSKSSFAATSIIRNDWDFNIYVVTV